MKFRKKPVEIEAMLFSDEESGSAILQWVGNDHVSMHMHSHGIPAYLDISTPEGIMIAPLGSWIIKGVEGEFYPCKPEIFDATYDKIEE